ncbi:MAG: tRNA (adenosine(37)-N6)-threonylcarbamoyltransferase complex dimerization subunit type 1 TsaB [Pirellulales bacterium]
MKTLAIDTSLAAGSVAALHDGRVAERRLDVPGDHARLLADAVAEVAGELGWQPHDADLIAVIRGPGSFTGLRVGVSTAKALAWATGARLVGVCSFEVIAARTARLTGRHDQPIAIGFEAGRGDVYVATAVPSKGSPTGWEVGAAALHPLAAWIASLSGGTVVSGPALELAAPALSTRADLVVAPPESWQPSAVEAGRLALLRTAAGAVDDAFTLVPEYLRPSYADERRAGTLGP